MPREFNTGRRYRCPHRHFRNGYYHGSNSAKGLPEGFSLIENGNHQREDGGLSDQFKIIFDKKRIDRIDKEGRIRIIEKAQAAEIKIRYRKK